MATYSATAINVGTFNLGESDRLLTLFSSERGLIRAVAKGARKPGSKMSGRAEPLSVNRLLIAAGKSLDIITQAETIEMFSRLRNDLVRLSCGLYYAELTRHFGLGLSGEAKHYLDFLMASLRKQDEGTVEPAALCLQFQMGLLEMLGYKPELETCVSCRRAPDNALAKFHHDLGGVVCRSCIEGNGRVREPEISYEYLPGVVTEITPLVLKQLMLSSQPHIDRLNTAQAKPLYAAQRLMQTYIEHRAGRRMKSLDLIRNWDLPK